MTMDEGRVSAGNILDMLPRASGGDVATAARMDALAAALCSYPRPIAQEAASHILRTERWAPAPAAVHDYAEPRMRELRVIVANADRAINHIAGLGAHGASAKDPDATRRADVVARALRGFKRMQEA